MAAERKRIYMVKRTLVERCFYDPDVSMSAASGYPSPLLTRREYEQAVRADHGTPRRYLAGCRCELCATKGNKRFAHRLRVSRR